MNTELSTRKTINGQQVEQIKMAGMTGLFGVDVFEKISSKLEELKVAVDTLNPIKISQKAPLNQRATSKTEFTL